MIILGVDVLEVEESLVESTAENKMILSTKENFIF